MLAGLDQLSEGHLSATRRRLRSAGIAVLTHSAAIDRRGRQTLEVLDELGISPAIVFGPEHGLHAVEQAQEAVSGDADRAGPRLVSLYGDTKESLSPKPEHFEDIDVLVVDLCDVGSRYYTYVWSALLAARAAREAGVHTLVLDRPNPISGNPSLCEGAPQAEGFESFVGLERIPIRHALTLGELVAHFLAAEGAELGRDGALSVVATRGWERQRSASAWGRPFVGPSPNMPAIETALVYPGGCLLEGTNLSEGRGTTTPFQAVGAPFLDGERLRDELMDRGLPGLLARPIEFRPTFDKFAGEVCRGVMLHVTDEETFRPVATYLTLISLARSQAPDDFRFTSEPYEFETEIPAFDLLTGSDYARKAIIDEVDLEDVVRELCPVPMNWVETVADAEDRVSGPARA